MASNVAMSITFEDVAGVVIKTAMRFTQEYGGDLDERIADAMYHYIGAYEDYVEGVGTFKGWVDYRIYHRLLDDERKKWRREKLARMIPLKQEREWVDEDGTEVVIEPEGIAVHDKGFNLNLFLIGLSDDAAAVVRMVFETPKALTKDIKKRPGGANPYNIRTALWSYLRRVVEWSKERTQRAYDEIKEALKP